MSGYSVVLQNNKIVKASNFGDVNDLKFTKDGKVQRFSYEGTSYYAVFIYSTKTFLDYVNEEKFKTLIANEKALKGNDYRGVDVKLWRNAENSDLNLTFKSYDTLEPGVVNDDIYGLLRDQTGLCFNYFTWNYTIPYLNPVNPILAPGSGPSFACEVFSAGSVAGNFFETFKNKKFYNLETGSSIEDIRLVGEVASLMQKTSEQMIDAFNGFAVAGIPVDQFSFSQDVQGNYLREQLSDYKRGLELWVKIYNENLEQLKKLDEAEKVYVICDILYRYHMLSLLSVDVRIQILKVLCERPLMNWYYLNYKTGFQHRESLALRIIEQVPANQADEFLHKIISSSVSAWIKGEVKPITLYKKLFYRIDDFFGSANFTAFVKKLQQLVLIKNGIDPEDNTVTYSPAELKSKTAAQFLWGARKNKNKIRYRILKSDHQKIYFEEEFCANTKLIETITTGTAGVPVSNGFTEECVQKDKNPITVEHFDLVSIHFYEEPSFVDTTSNASYNGTHVFTFAGFVDYLIEKENTQIVVEILNAALFVISLTVGVGELIAAVRSGVQVTRLFVGAMIVSGDVSAYLTTNLSFRTYLQQRYPQDYQHILDVMLIAGALASLGATEASGAGILNKYSAEEAARFIGTSEQIITDINITSKLTANELKILREGIERFENGLYKVRYEPEVLAAVRRAKGVINFFDDPSFRFEIKLMTEGEQLKFLDYFGVIPEGLKINLKRNPDFVAYWNSLSNAEKDVFNLNKVEYFNNWYKAKVVVLAKELSESGLWFDVRKGATYKLHELETLVEMNIKYKANLRPNLDSEAGDAIATTGIEINKSFDAMGVPKEAFEKPNWTNPTKKNKSIIDFKKAIDKHFKKIVQPEAGIPALDKFILDFKNFDDFDPNLRTQIMNYINDNYSHLVNTTHFEIIN